ncbi:MAG: CBS domain-containing protein [Alphaproteobacteria bacterium]|nr:CBS domain-containing protein [Alphaproteobacteria bacterium]MBF0129269.1 CBS domain-containing protein [Alphaproteobacteria bacterium]
MSVEKILAEKGRNVVTVMPEHTTGDAAKLLTEHKIGMMVVCDVKGRIEGMLSERDLVKGMAKYGPAVLTMPVRNLMTSKVITCTGGDDIKELMEIMTSRRIRHLPVVEGGRLVGIISLGDLVHFRHQQTQMEMGVLRDYALTRKP